jgi:hypothetical protein
MELLPAIHVPTASTGYSKSLAINEDTGSFSRSHSLCSSQPHHTHISTARQPLTYGYTPPPNVAFVFIRLRNTVIQRSPMTRLAVNLFSRAERTLTLLASLKWTTSLAYRPSAFFAAPSRCDMGLIILTTFVTAFTTDLTWPDDITHVAS